MNSYLSGFEIIHNLIKKRWVPEILHCLKEKSMTYTDLVDSIDYISDTELNRKLKLLLDHKCILKDDDLYKITSHGYKLEHIFSHIYDLGKSLLVE